MSIKPPTLSIMKSLIPLNAFSSVTVRNLVYKDGANVDQTFHRGVVKPGEHVLIPFEILSRPDGIPPRPKSLLPPPGDMHLDMSLGEKLGSGRVGTVRVANVLNPSIDLPPLVLKISRHGRSVNLAREAWFYEELEQLQGISVARCYGFFQARVEDGHEVSTWDYYNGHLSDSENFDLEKEDYEKDISGQGQVLSILLLERLGSRMPIGQPMESIEKDVSELYNDLAHFGIESLDIRYDNILSAGEGYQDDSSGVVCPIHGHVHHWRLVDFDYARKTDGIWSWAVFWNLGNEVPSESNLVWRVVNETKFPLR